MKLLKKLQHPFALVAQGFVLGGILFFAMHPESLDARARGAAAQASAMVAPQPGS